MAELWPICPSKPQAKYSWSRYTCDRLTPCSAWHGHGVNISRMPKARWTFSEYSSVTRQGRPALHFYLFLVESAWWYYIFLSEKAKFVGFFFTVTQSSSFKGRTSHPTSINVSAGSRGYYHLSSTNAEVAEVTTTYPPQLLASPHAGKLQLNYL